MAFGLAVYASPSSLPPPTQDSLPAAGQALPDGLSTRKVPTKGFKVASLHLILLSQALLGTMIATYAGNGSQPECSGHALMSAQGLIGRGVWMSSFRARIPSQYSAASASDRACVGAPSNARRKLPFPTLISDAC